MVHNYTLHGKLKINKHELYYRPLRMNSGAPEGCLVHNPKAPKQEHMLGKYDNAKNRTYTKIKNKRMKIHNGKSWIIQIKKTENIYSNGKQT